MILAGFSALVQGLAVGTTASALMTKFLIVPRIIQVFRLQEGSLRFCAAAAFWGIVTAAVADTCAIQLKLSWFFMIITCILCGVYAGLLAMAAAEVLDIVPHLSMGRALKGAMQSLLLAAVLGKAFGALMHFLDQRWIL